ncbi:hypothetical protein RRG08_031973 [Elysia crispata]|uniref:C-type lectin domain-containing protein n=1 Tax=Elysia crispata TaxID=231223 RepID=A0AAE1D9N1_9GAST|nr:hypothetical protein RRG08_031973 [Elysia crispata]
MLYFLFNKKTEFQQVSVSLFIACIIYFLTLTNECNAEKMNDHNIDMAWIGLKFNTTKKVFKWISETEEIPTRLWCAHHIRPSYNDDCVPIYTNLHPTSTQFLCRDPLPYFCEIHPVCVNKTYGVRCSKRCSLHCDGVNKTCDSKTGSCDLGCFTGYQGELCDREPNKMTKMIKYSSAAIISSIVFAITILSARAATVPIPHVESSEAPAGLTSYTETNTKQGQPASWRVPKLAERTCKMKIGYTVILCQISAQVTMQRQGNSGFISLMSLISAPQSMQMPTKSGLTRV